MTHVSGVNQIPVLAQGAIVLLLSCCIVRPQCLSFYLSFCVSLICPQVLIEAKSPDLLPEWLRFVKGVVDSEDLPLSLSREKPQDTALIKRIGGVLTKKILRFLQDMMRKDPEKYKEKFFKEFGAFLKEVSARGGGMVLIFVKDIRICYLKSLGWWGGGR